MEPSPLDFNLLETTQCDCDSDFRGSTKKKEVNSNTIPVLAFLASCAMVLEEERADENVVCVYLPKS